MASANLYVLDEAAFVNAVVNCEPSTGLDWLIAEYVLPVSENVWLPCAIEALYATPRVTVFAKESEGQSVGSYVASGVASTAYSGESGHVPSGASTKRWRSSVVAVLEFV